MRPFKTLLMLASLFFVNTLYAATDHNSSRSNKTSSSQAPKETKVLIKNVSANALAVSKRMIEVDQSDNFDGEYLITVEMRVSLQRCVRVENQIETICSDAP